MPSFREKMRHALSIDWDKIDLNRHYRVIMDETGVCEQTVRSAQKARGIKHVLKRGPAKGSGKFQNIDPKTLDFNLTDEALAEQLGCHKRTVQQLRLDNNILFASKRKKL